MMSTLKKVAHVNDVDVLQFVCNWFLLFFRIVIILWRVYHGCYMRRMHKRTTICITICVVRGYVIEWN